MKTINVQLTVEEVNTILNALGTLPFGQVYELIQNIQNQATPQLQEMQKEQQNGIKKSKSATKTAKVAS